MKRILILLILISLSFLLKAQCTDFIIYQTKGNVKLLHGENAQPAAKNLKLTGEVRLSVGSDAAVILLSGKDKALRITTPGTFTMDEIHTTCIKNQSSLTKEYLNYVAQSILDKGEPKTAMVIKGAVYRTRTEFEKTAMILPVDSSVVSGEVVTFAWHLTPGVPKYLLIYENGVNEVYSKLLADTAQTVKTSLFKPGAIYFWLVSNTNTPSDKEPRFTFLLGQSDWQYKYLDDQWNATMKELENEIDNLQNKMKKK